MKNYPYHQSPFYKCTTKRKLSEILKIDIRVIKEITRKIEDCTAYHSFTERKGRYITSPNRQLKNIQRRINGLLSRIEVPDWIHGGIKNKSIQTNASTHKKSKFFLMLDIKSFFDNCRRENVYQYFCSKMKMSKDTAKIMTDLTTFNNKLATGSPTSTYLSFLVYEDMFTKINKIILNKGMIMTLYVDDITISGNEEIKELSALISQVDIIMKEYGHRLNHAKTNYQWIEDFPIITGVAIDPQGVLRVPNKQRYKIVKSLRKINDVQTITSTKSRIMAAQQIEEGLFSNTLKTLSSKRL